MTLGFHLRSGNVTRKKGRLRTSSEFTAVWREGKSWSDKFLVLEARSNGLGITRIGFSVGKRLGNAVMRNKVKRRLREVARLSEIQEGWDLVLIARKDAAVVDFHELRSSMNKLFRLAGILDNFSTGPGFPRKVNQCAN